MKLILTILFILTFLFDGKSQEAVTSLDTNMVLIGDHTPLNLLVRVPLNTNLQWHELDSTYAGIEILNVSKIDTVQKENEIVYVQKINLIPFDSGYYALTPISFPISTTGRWDTLKSNALALKVESIQIDTTMAIKPIKPPISIPWHWKDALPYAGVLLGIIALVALLLFLLKRKKEKPEIIELPIDLRSAHQIAIEKLEQLELKEFWQKGKIKEYYVGLTYILREYIENRFETDALESTSDEIIDSLKISNIKTTLKQRLRNLLDWADLVKFAKASPSGETHIEALKTVKKFIRKTSLKKGVSE